MRSVIQILLIILLTIGLVLSLSFVFSSPEPAVAVEETSLTTVQTQMPVPPETILPVTAPETVPETEPALRYDTVPRFYQADYPYEEFSEGTVIDSGCSITCLAMVASYLTDNEYTPAELAYHFNIQSMNNVQKLEHANEVLRLPAVRMDDAQKILDALKEGKVAIVMVNGDSIFTSTGHFIVIAGVTEEEKILINDPNGKIYPEADVYMTTRFQEGFERFHLFQGFMGGWVYDKKDMPQEPYIHPAELPRQAENRYQGYRLTREDENLLAAFLWAEAKNQTQEVRQAIVEVLLNRVVSHSFPYTVEAVIGKGEYFDRLGKMKYAKDVGEEFYQAVDAAMFGPYILPEDVYYFSQWETGGDIWGTIDSYTFRRARQ